ncbi:MAG: hypothetical protein JWR00_2553 [Rubritepida sp.]|jgi:hypothetical protein|nr:hypothetical protein [Rubritepida sp.]
MSERFQVVFNPDGLVEMMLLDGEIRTLTFDSTDSPFTVDAMNDPEVRSALYQWMRDTNAEGWVGWQELGATLAGMGVDIKRVVARHPA